MTVRLVAIMFAATVVAALVVQGLFSLLGLVPEDRPDVESITERAVTWNYTTALNIVFLLVAAVLVTLALRAREPEHAHAHAH
jgi:hypothetical protein